MRGGGDERERNGFWVEDIGRYLQSTAFGALGLLCSSFLFRFIIICGGQGY